MLPVFLILVSSLFVYPFPDVYADDLKIKEDCISTGWEVIITDSEGNPLKNVRVMTINKISSSNVEESFFTDDKGIVVIPFSSITGFVKLSKGGYNDQRFSVSCSPLTSHTIKTGSNFSTYDDPIYGIKIDYPSDWTIDQSDPNFQTVLISPLESALDKYQESVLIMVQSTEITNSADFASDVISSIKPNILKFNLLENFQTSIGGQSAQKVTFTGIFENDFEVKDTVYFTIVEGTGYMIIFDAEIQKYSTYQPVFQQMIDSFEIKSVTIPSKTTGVSPIVPQIVSGKYVNSDAGIEMEFPERFSGFEMSIPKDIDYSELSAELQSMAEIYSGMTVVMMLPAESVSTGNIETMMLSIMETSSIESFSEFISQTVEGAMSQSSDNVQDFDIESQPECDITNGEILEINEMKTTRMNFECQDSATNMAFTMSMYMFITPEHIISPMYIVIHEPDEESDLSIFEDSLDTLSIENTVDISDPHSYAELFGLNVTQEKVMIENKSHEIEIVSDSTITSFSFDENKNELIFELQKDKVLSLGSMEIYLNNIIQAPYTVTIDGKDNDAFMVTEDKTTGQTSISLSYLNPVDKIIIKGNNSKTLSTLQNELGKTSTEIPEWVKNNALWWADGTLDDKAFVGGVQFLIKENLIQIPEIAKSTTSNSQEIPLWIKNNADWWGQGLISDDDFLKGIQFMIENGIVVVE